MTRVLALGRGFRLGLMALLLAGALALTWYCHARLRTGTVFTHLFYVPILLAALWWRWAGLAVPVFLAAVLGASHTLLSIDSSPGSDYLRGAMFLGVGLVAVLLREELGRSQAALVDQRESLGRLAGQLALVEEDLRQRVSAELHDHVGQALVAAKIQAGLLGKAGSLEAKDRLADDLIGLLDRVLADVRSLTFQLCPPALYEMGLEAGISWLLERFQRRHGVACRLEEDGASRALARPLQSFLFQAVREALHNVAKHARASSVRVAIASADGRVQVTVEDDGRGFDPDALPLPDGTSGGFGLFSLRERLQGLGGSLEVLSAPGRGCRLAMVCPETVLQDRPVSSFQGKTRPK